MEIVEQPSYHFHSDHLSEKFALRQIESLFAATPVAADLTRIAYKNRLGDGYFFIFNFGTICFFNTPKEEQKQIIDVLATRHQMIQHGREWDNFTLEIVPAKKSTVHVGFNKVTLSTLSFDRVDVIALVLAESVTIDFYEVLMDELLEKSNVTAEILTKTGRLPGSARSINQSIGLTMSTRQMIVASLYLLDKPDVLWENEHLEKLYRGMFRVFEMRERFMGIEFKLRTLQESMALLSALVNNRKAERLELTIIILIMVEILLFCYDVFFK